jgi:hypothetical protein
MDENKEMGDRLIFILWLFLFGSKIYTFVGSDINSGEIQGYGKDANTKDCIYFISSSLFFVSLAPYNSFFYYVIFANSYTSIIYFLYFNIES